ncbi:MAG: helix-turn-helix domain-containing protein [Treponema sp.]|nr:helix-turn-helix domain-containing protein [Treponema sp.]
MESLGEKLWTTREGKGISLDQAGLDTKLAIRYLEALEDENFSKFPGEAYITGFIRNYGDYLDLNVDELLSLYRAIKIQEQPIPVEELLRKPSVLPKVAIGVAVALLIFAIAGGVFLFFVGRTVDAGVAVSHSRIPIEYILSGDSFEHRFFQGDTLLIPMDFDFTAEGVEQHRIELLDVVGDDVIIQTPNGPVIVDLLRHASVDLNNNGIFDLRIRAVDYVRNNISMGALLRFERYTALSFIEEMQVVPTGAATVTGQAHSSVIFTSPNPYPFTLQANFQGGNMFRWEVIAEPARRERNERFFQRLDELTVPHVHNGIRIWTSNAQAARFQVIGGGRTVPIELGNPGEVVVADIRWVRGEDNIFRLIVARLEA